MWSIVRRKKNDSAELFPCAVCLRGFVPGVILSRNPGKIKTRAKGVYRQWMPVPGSGGAFPAL